MVVLNSMPEQHIINGLKGRVDFYVWKGIPVARRWPRSPGQRRAQSVEAQWPAWTYASRIWPYLSDHIQDSYRASALGTEYTGRDLATLAYFSGYITPPDLD